MQINLRQQDDSTLSLEIPDLPDYPNVMISGNRAFKFHPKTDEYVETSVYMLPSSVVGGIDYMVACIGLIMASEHLARLFSDGTSSDPLSWRLRCATEAITLIKNRTPKEIEEYLQINYPSGL